MTINIKCRSPYYLLVLICMSFVGGCGSETTPKIVRVAYVYGPTELLHASACRFADFVNEKSDGRLQVRLYPSGQLGDEREIVEGLKLGSVDIVITGCAIVGWYAPEYGAIEAPFVWRDFDHVMRVWQSDIGTQLRDTMRNMSGIDMRNLWYRGPRYLTTTSRQIHTPDDLLGLKLRVPELDVYMTSWRAFGANVTPLPFNDLFMALKLGVVEGQENPLSTIYGNNLHEVQKYIMETQHLIGFYIVATGQRFAAKFGEHEQRCIISSLEDATRWHNEELSRSELEYRELIKAAGVRFLEVDRDAFRQIAGVEIPAKFECIWKQGLYRDITEFP